jgi:hypothetical protein
MQQTPPGPREKFVFDTGLPRKEPLNCFDRKNTALPNFGSTHKNQNM